MPNSHEENPHSRPLANAVEVLGNVLYLIEHSVGEPDSISKLLKLGEPAMETLRRAALGIPEQVLSGNQDGQTTES